MAKSRFKAASCRALNVSDWLHHLKNSACSSGLSAAAAALTSSSLLLSSSYYGRSVVVERPQPVGRRESRPYGASLQGTAIVEIPRKPRGFLRMNCQERGQASTLHVLSHIPRLRCAGSPHAFCLAAVSRRTLALLGVPKCRRVAICLTESVVSLRRRAARLAAAPQA
jgi:hypothetical protein